MAQKVKSNRVFYITVMTRKGSIITAQTRLEPVIRSYSDLELDDSVSMPFKRNGAVNLLDRREHIRNKSLSVANGYVVEAGYINVDTYLEEARDDGR